MARTVIIRTEVSENGTSLVNQPVSYSAALVAIVDGEAIAGSATTQVIATLDVSAVKAFMVVSTVAATLKTNSSSEPDETITLVANQPYVWHTTDYNAFLLETDVTSFYFTVAGATAGTVTILAAVDPTP